MDTGTLRSYVNRLLRVVQRRGVKEFTGVLAANVTNNVVSFAITVLAARQLGPGEFGVAGVAISTVVVLGLVLDFGLSISLVRFYNSTEEERRQNDILRTVLRLKTVILIATVPLAFVAPPVITGLFPILEGRLPVVWASVWAAGLASMWKTVRAIEQAKRDFGSFQRYTFIYAALRVLSGTGLWLFGYGVTPFTLLLCLYVIPQGLIIAFNLIYTYRRSIDWLGSFAAHVDVRDLAKYGAWVAISAVLYVSVLRLPQVALAQEATPEEVGLYSAALTFIAAFSMLNDALRTLILPEVSSLKTESDRQSFRTSFWKWSPVFFATSGGAVVALSAIQYFVLGAKYSESIHVFIVLSVGVSATLFLSTYNVIIHSYGVPNVDAYANIFRFSALGGALLIWNESALVVAVLLAVALFAGEFGTFAYVRRVLSEGRSTSY